MAIDDILTTTQINTLVNNYVNSETSKSVTPLQTKKSKYQNLTSVYGSFSSKLQSLKTVLDQLRKTDSESLFKAKTSTLSSSDFFSVTTDSTAGIGNYDVRINQLAKNDTLLSSLKNTADANVLSGDHEFLIKTMNGNGIEVSSHIKVNFSGSETNKTAIDKITTAINSDKAEVTSSLKSTGSAYSGGPGSLNINVSGTDYKIDVTGGGTYDQLIDEIVTSVNSSVTGMTASKVSADGKVSLKFTLNDNTKDFSISNLPGGNDIVSDLSISATKEKSSAGTITASSFSPISGSLRLSITSQKSGLDYRITGISDINGGTALQSFGLNFDSARTQYDKLVSPDAAGFLYSDITTTDNLLNSKLTFNGLDIQRNSNTISDLVSGVTFSLKSVMKVTDQSVNLISGDDTSSVRKNLENYISKFNDLYSFIISKSTGTSTELRGDSTTQALTSLLSSSALNAVPGVTSENLNMLAKIGIKFSSKTGLSISDSTLLDKNLKENMASVESLFNSTNGIATTLYDKTSVYLGSDGSLNKSLNSFGQNISWLSDRIAATQKRVNKGAESLRKRYEQLQVQIASLMTTQSYFGS